MSLVITVSGLPGSGTSTAARRVAEVLGIEHLDGGTLFRAMAREAGLSLAEFAAQAERNDTIDRALDDRLTERARRGEVLLESRLAAWLVTGAGIDALRVWIHCDEPERARRVGGRDGHEHPQALVTNRTREESERARYRQYYGIDLADMSVYDLVLDSTATGPADLAVAITEAARAT